MAASKILALRLPVDWHKELKTLAATSGKTMTELALRAIKFLLEEQKEEIPASVRKELRTPRIYTKEDLNKFVVSDKLSAKNKAWLEKNFSRNKHEKTRSLS